MSESPQTPPSTPAALSHSEVDAFSCHALSLTEIPFTEIDLDDERFALRFGRTAARDLATSLARTGMRNPPLLAPTGTGYRVVYGFARAHAWREMGHEKLVARVAPVETPESALLVLAIEDNVDGRGLNPIEQGLALRKLSAHLPVERLASDILPLLGRKPSHVMVERLLGWLDAPPAIQAALASGRIAEGSMDHLRLFPHDEQEIAVSCIGSLRMSTGASRDFLRQGLEICRRDGVALAVLLDEMGYDPDRDEEPAELPLRRNSFLAALRRKRYPILTHIERDFASAHAGLGLPDSIRIHPPRDFEGNAFRVEMRVGSADDLIASADLLRERLHGHPDLVKRLFDARLEDES